MPDVLRPGVLDGLVVRTYGGAEGPAQRLAALGAEVAPLGGDPGDEESLAAAATQAGAVDVLVVDGERPFRAAGGGIAGLRAAADGAFAAARAVATACWIEGGRPGGKVVLIAPRPGAGEHAEAAGAALENLARTLSVEWARFGVRAVALRPGDRAADEEIAELVAYLASPAGDYVSGTALAPGGGA